MHKLAIMDETALTTHVFSQNSLRWILRFSCGIATQGLFAVTVVGLFTFLRFGGQSPGRHWLLVDTVLALQFAIPHSLLLHPGTRQYLIRWVIPEFYGNMFCVVTCLSLWLMFRFWQTSDATLWDPGQIGQLVVLGGFYGSWIGLLYSISLTGFGYQTGWTQWAYPLMFSGPLAKAVAESSHAVEASSIAVAMGRPVRVSCRTPRPTQRRSA